MKQNGFNCPYHPFQITSWVVFAINLGSYFFIMAPCLGGKVPIIIMILSILYFILNWFVMYYAISAMRCNPTDRSVLSTRQLLQKGIIPEKDDLTLFWQVCEAYVHERTKHCGSCNRWVELFDHHCKWLNNCIGAKNYKTFIILIVLVGIQSLYYTIIGFTFLIFGFGKKKQKADRTGFCLIEKDDNKGVALFITLLVLIMMLISAVIFIGIVMLLKLHFKLMKFDFTTFEYIQYMEDRKERLYKLKNK